jgi:hypothetical protein
VSFSSLLRSLFIDNDGDAFDYAFVPGDIAKLHQATLADGGAALDAPTVEGMLLEPYLASLTPATSIFGQQKLYQRLHQGVAVPQRLAQAERVQSLMRDPSALAAKQEDCKLLRKADAEVAGLLFGDEACPPVPLWAPLAWAVGPALVLSALLTFIWPLAWIGVALSVFGLLWPQMRLYRRIIEWKRTLRTVHLMLATCSRLGGSVAEQALPFNRAITRLPPYLYVVPFMEQYNDWGMLGNVRHYFRSTQLVYAQRGYLRECFELCAELEADLALARHLLAVPVMCWAQPGSDERMQLDGVTHPMIAHAQPLSITLRDKGAFISGRNGVGKSTLLRTVGLNLITARAFGFCYAGAAIVPDLLVCASMQSEDSLLTGESLYMAELRHAHTMLANASGPHRAIYLIDEIFRGTNHLESVAGAAAVLNELAQHGWVIVSSHNLVLATLLGHRLEPLYVEPVDGKLTLLPGVLQQTNGLSLLAERGFGPGVDANAAKVYDWLGGYLAHPAHGADVLAPVCKHV